MTDVPIMTHFMSVSVAMDCTPFPRPIHELPLLDQGLMAGACLVPVEAMAGVSISKGSCMGWLLQLWPGDLKSVGAGHLYHLAGHEPDR